MRKRDGSADMGVSMFMLLLWGGAGRANGLGGPEAPAESMPTEVPEGDGGGSTCTMERCDVTPVETVPRGEADSLVALPPSEASSGI